MSTEPAYQVTKGGALDVDTAMYARIAESDRTTVESFIIPIRTGRAWTVPAGHLCRITVVEGPQVGDLNIWNANNPRERMWAAKTRQLQAAHVRLYDRLWSNLPYLRPLVTVVGDSLADYGVDEDGGRVHDLLGSRCDPYTNQLLSGERFDYHCHSNLTRAVLPHGLNETDVHDVLNVFQVTGLTSEGKYFVKPSPARAGDFVEFFAEIDVLAAISVCPHGDLSVAVWGPNAGDPLATCRPLGVEIWQPAPELLQGWKPPAVSDYHGGHGLRSPS